MVTTTEIHNGDVFNEDVFKFTIEDGGMVLVSNVGVANDPFDLNLSALRRNDTGTNEDYEELTPNIVFDLENNYQILGPGNYALTSQGTSNIIIVVTQ